MKNPLMFNMILCLAICLSKNSAAQDPAMNGSVPAEIKAAINNFKQEQKKRKDDNKPASRPSEKEIKDLFACYQGLYLP